jgi:hypothetical protein
MEENAKGISFTATIGGRRRLSAKSALLAVQHSLAAGRQLGLFSLSLPCLSALFALRLFHASVLRMKHTDCLIDG